MFDLRIGRLLISTDLLFHPFLVQIYDPSFQFLLLFDHLDGVVDVVQEFFDLLLLLEPLSLLLGHFFLHTILPHPQILHNQPQIGINLLEVRHLLFHLRCLLLQLLDLHFTWAEITF